MKNIFLLLCTLCSCTLFSQELTPSNINSFPGIQTSHDAAFQNGDDLIVAGKITGAVDFDFGEDDNLSPAESDQDLFVAKYQGDQELDWVLFLDGSNVGNEVQTIYMDDVSDVYVTGSFTGSLDISGTGTKMLMTNTTSTFIAKYASDGSFLWGHQVGNDDRTQTPGHFFVRGDWVIFQIEYRGEIDVDPGPGETILDDDSNAVIVYDPNGGLVNAYSHRGGIDIEDAVMDDDGNIYISGQFAGISSIDFKSNQSLFPGGLFDGYVAKYNTSFDLEWVSSLRKTLATNNIYQIALDENQDLIAIGLLEDGVAVGNDTTLNRAHYLLNITKEGDITNPVEFLPEESFATDFEIDSEGRLITTGCFINPFDIDPTEESKVLTPMEDKVNFFFAALNPDYSLLVSDEMYSDAIPQHSLYLDQNDRMTVLSDFQGSGKVVFGSEEDFEAEQNENFLLYNLEIKTCETTYGDISIEVCEFADVNGILYDISGVYQQMLVNVDGCDSILRIDATIFPNKTILTSFTSCGPFEYEEGLFIEESGMYVLQDLTVNGCDSLTFVELEIISFDPSITTNVNELISNETVADAYQWYECGGTVIIEGATDRIFTPEVDGSYQVNVIKDECSFFSDCAEFMLVSTNEIESKFSISPNPTFDIFRIEGLKDQVVTSIVLFDIHGRLMRTFSNTNTGTRLDISDLNAGTYILNISSKKRNHFIKIMKL